MGLRGYSERTVKPSTPDVVRLVRELLRETRKSGIPASREIAVSDAFFNDIERRYVAVGHDFRRKFTEVKAAVTLRNGNASRTWISSP